MMQFFCERGFSLSDSNADPRSIRVRCGDWLRIGTADTSTRHNAAADIPALLPASQGGGGAVSAPAGAAARTNLCSARESDAGVDVVQFGVVQVDGDDRGAVRQCVRHDCGTVRRRRCTVRRLAVVAFNKAADNSSFYCLAIHDSREMYPYCSPLWHAALSRIGKPPPGP